MSIFFTSDLHLGHTGILCHQPNRIFVNTDEMDAVIIDVINSEVKCNDVLWILGDVVWKASKAGHYRQRLKVRELHVVQGNHDSASLRNHVSSMVLMAYIKIAQQKFHLSHYPHASWRGRIHGSIHLYGHCHGSMEEKLNEIWPDRKAMDVGIDCAYKLFREWRPFSLDEILERFK